MTARVAILERVKHSQTPHILRMMVLFRRVSTRFLDACCLFCCLETSVSGSGAQSRQRRLGAGYDYLVRETSPECKYVAGMWGTHVASMHTIRETSNADRNRASSLFSGGGMFHSCPLHY